jgi:hypothetical protein
MDAHDPTTKKKNKSKRSRYGDQNVVAATQTTAKMASGICTLHKQ